MPALRITVTGQTTDAVRAMYLIGLLLRIDNDSVRVEPRTLPTVACVTASVEVPDPIPLHGLVRLAANTDEPDQADEHTADRADHG